MSYTKNTLGFVNVLSPLIWIAHWVDFTWLLFPSPARNMRSSFLAIRSLVPGGKIHEYAGAPIKTMAQKFLTHHASPHSASNCWSKLLFKCFHYFVLPVASAPGKGELSEDFGFT